MTQRSEAWPEAGPMSTVDRSQSAETPNSTRWTTHHPAERTLLCGGLLLIAFRHVDPAASALLLAVATTAAFVAGLSLRQWLTWLFLPLGFVVLSVLPFAIAAPSSGTALHALPLAGWWSLEGAKHGAALGLHALACASAVILLAATTPIHQCALLSRKLGVPSLLTDSVILTARLQAVVRTRLVARHHAASFRLGGSSWTARWRTSALLGAGLFLDTAHRASRLERGLELRGGFSTEAVVSAGWAAISTRRVFLVFTVLLLVAMLAEFRVLAAR